MAALKDTRAKAAPTNGWYAYLKTLKEETSSKVFYRAFQARHINSDVAALHDTPDWNHPD